MTDSKLNASQGIGQLFGLKLGYDEIGRAYFEGKIRLRHVDDYALLLKQTQAAELAFTFETNVELLPLFPEAVSDGARDAIEKFRDNMQDMVDDPENGITGVSVTAGGRAAVVAEKR